MPTPDDFFAIDIRVGTVLQAAPFPEARKPSIKLEIDFGPELGIKRSSAQITVHYTPEQLVGRQVVAVVNIGERRIAGYVSQVLCLGAMPLSTEVILLNPDQPVANGTSLPIVSALTSQALCLIPRIFTPISTRMIAQPPEPSRVDAVLRLSSTGASLMESCVKAS